MIEVSTAIFAIDTARTIIGKYIDSEIERTVIETVTRHVQEKAKSTLEEIKQRTIVYIVLAGISLIWPVLRRIVLLPEWATILWAFTVIGLIGFYMLKTAKTLSSIILFLENLEVSITADLKSEFDKATSSSKFMSLASKLSGKNIKEYVPLVIFTATTQFGLWLNANKKILYWRLASYAVISYALGDSLSHLLFD